MKDGRTCTTTMTMLTSKLLRLLLRSPLQSHISAILLVLAARKGVVETL